MKIRTDFVTNSSSSSFTVSIDIKTVEGKSYRATIEPDDGGGNGSANINCSAASLLACTSVASLMDTIYDAVTVTTSRWGNDEEDKKYFAKGVQKLATRVKNNVQSLDQISTLTFRRKWHAWGECSSCFGTNIGVYAPELCSVAEKLCDAYDEGNEEECEAYKKELLFYLKYYDGIIEGPQGGSFPSGFMGSSATCVLDIYGDEDDLVEFAYDIAGGSISFFDDDDGVETTIIDMQSKTIRQGAIYGDCSCDGIQKDDSEYEELRKFAYARDRKRREERLRKKYQYIDENATVTFLDKHFVLTGFGNEDDVIGMIGKRGGYVHDSMVRSADYLVICLNGAPGEKKYKKALEWREKGAQNLIISDEQLYRAFDEVPVLTQEERQALLERRKAESEERKRAAEEKLRMAEAKEPFMAKEATDVAYTVRRVQTSEEIKRVLDVLCADEYKDSPSLEEMALIAGMTPETFRKRFSAEVGTSPKNYLIQCKMERAKALLRQQKYTVREVGAAVGIPDPYHFSKQFKSVVGVSPSDFGNSSALVTEESQPQVRHAVQETEPEQKKTESFEAKEAADAGYIVRRVQISEEIQRVLDVLRADEYKESPSLEEMALIAGMTPETFRKRFSAEMGTSPKNYLIQCKMERAKALLRQQKYTVREVGAAVGIPDPYHFSKQFKSVVGLSPSDFVNEEIRKMFGE